SSTNARYTLSLHDALPIFIKGMTQQLMEFMEQHQFETIDDFRGHSLQYVTSHTDLVARQAAARGNVVNGVATRAHADAQWSGTQDRKSTRLNSSHVKISYA